jgi:serine/threonine protein kinase
MFNSLPPNNPHKIDFFQTAKSFAQMNHPNIANIYDVDDDLGLTYVAREYIEGLTINEIFADGNHFNAERLIQIMYQVFKGLHYSHRLGFYHLNLKPENIRVSNNNETKIMDFLVPTPLINAYRETDPGYRNYQSPEQLFEQDVDERTDIFAMGVILYETITQKHPFIGDSQNDIKDVIMQVTPQPPSELNARIPKFFDALLLKCMAAAPDKRIQTVEQIVTLLKKNFERTLFSNYNYQIAKSRESY